MIEESIRILLTVSVITGLVAMLSLILGAQVILKWSFGIMFVSLFVGAVLSLVAMWCV